jgi:hypothetical protein
MQGRQYLEGDWTDDMTDESPGGPAESDRDQDARALELAHKRWERDRRISQGGDRDLGGLAERGKWDSKDSLCQTYLREALRDVANGTVTDFQPVHGEGEK